MTRIISHLLILLVLFTHSTMAMDVHIPHDHESDHISKSHSLDIDDVDTSSSLSHLERDDCSDAGGHCSHHQAHTAGLISVNTLSSLSIQPTLFLSLKSIAFVYQQTPPRRPPKA